MAALGILDLLALRGFDTSLKAKLVRHKDARYDVHNLLRDGWFEAYQSYQSKPVFHGLQQIVSFVGVGGTRSRFVGVYRVLGFRPGPEVPVPPGCPFQEFQNDSRFRYALERDPAFEEFEHRIVVDWGRGAIAWHQKLANKPVLELLPKGRLLEPFKDYLDFTLTHAELRHLVSNPEANAEWRARLSAVAGVYLILATATGAQYIGSAYGAEGIWGRWSSYAKNGHGGNIKLKDLVTSNPAYPSAFVYSILQILPRSLALAEVLDWERRYKEKLGTRAIGLNAN